MADESIKEVDTAVARELDIPELKRLGNGKGEGYINESIIYETGGGEKIFVKINDKLEAKTEARQMFEGEMTSLNLIQAMNIVKVPKPIKVIDLPGGGAALAMECIDFEGLSKYGGELGHKLACLHKHNADMLKQASKAEGFIGQGEQHAYVDKFGFHTVTFCGRFPQDNTWDISWIHFFANKLDYQFKRIERESGDREARELWLQLQHKLPKFFEGLDIKPALLHGDLWKGNVGETDTEPLMFDCHSYYGHSEFEIAMTTSMTTVFGGFSQSFYDAYFKVLPKGSGYSDRSDLYHLFNHINHWNHFGTKYRESSITAMKNLVKL